MLDKAASCFSLLLGDCIEPIKRRLADLKKYSESFARRRRPGVPANLNFSLSHAWILVHTGQRAIGLLKASDFDIISLDYNLRGELNGAGVAQALKHSRNQNARVFEMRENKNLLVKKPLAGSGDFKDEYRALLRMELMGIETALVKRAELDGQTVLILERIRGEISKNIMDVREGPQYRHLITQRTIDDLERIYSTLQQKMVHIKDFQFMVRESDGAVIMVDPKSLLPERRPKGDLEGIIGDFKDYFIT